MYEKHLTSAMLVLAAVVFPLHIFGAPRTLAETGPQKWTAIASSADGMHLAAAVQNGDIWTSSDFGATWTDRKGPGAREWISIASSADGTRLAAAVFGGRGHIWTSNDSGATWIKRASAGVRNWVSIAISSNGTHLAAAVFGGNIYTSSDSGSSWKDRAAIGMQEWVSIASSVDGKHLTAVAYGGKLYKSDDFGASWTAPYIKQYSEPAWVSVAASSDGTHVVAADTNGNLFVSSDSGRRWRSSSLSGPRNGVSVASDADGRHLAAIGWNRTGGYIYTSKDSGSTWTERTKAGFRKWASLTSSADGTHLAAAVFGGGIWTSTDSGKTWKDRGASVARQSRSATAHLVGTQSRVGWIDRPSAGFRQWNSIVLSRDGKRIVAGDGIGGIRTSIDSGATWAYRGGIGRFFVHFMTVNPYGEGKYVAAVGRHIWTSHDGGASWTEQTSAGARDWTSISVSANGKYLAAVVFNGDIWTSSNFGSTWSERAAAGSRQWTSIASSADGTHVAAATQYGDIWTSDDSGATWVDRTSAGRRVWISIASSSDGTHLAAVGTSGAEGQSQKIFISNNFGADWTERTPVGSRYWRAIALSKDDTKLAAVANDGDVFLSDDLGITWSKIHTAHPRGITDVAVALSSEGVHVVAARQGPGRRGDLWTFDSRPGVTTIAPARAQSVKPTTSESRRVRAESAAGKNIEVVWENPIAGGSRAWHSISSSSDGTHLAAAVTGGDIWTSSDSGATWTERKGAGSRDWQSIASSADGTHLAAVELNGDIFTSNDSGTTWIDRWTAGHRHWTSIASSADGTRLAAAVSRGDIYTSHDSGATWRNQVAAGRRDWKTIALSSDGTTLSAVTVDGVICTSNDGGTTWAHRIVDRAHNWSSITTSADGTDLAATESGGNIFTSNNSGLSWKIRTVTGWDSQAFPSPAPVEGTPGLSYAAIAGGYAVSAGSVKEGKVSIPPMWQGRPVVAVAPSGFANLGKLTEVVVPSSVMFVGDSAFANQYATELQSVTIYSRSVSIGHSAFKGDGALRAVAILGGKVTIGSEAFAGCALTRFILHSKLSSIGDLSFESAFPRTGVMNVTIPSTVTSIGRSAFEGSNAVISVDDANPKYTALSGAILNKARTELVEAPPLPSPARSYAVPAGVRVVGQFAFSRSGFTNVTLPSSVTSIEHDAFSQSRLSGITIPKGVTSIGSGAFSYCDELSAVAFDSAIPPVLGSERSAYSGGVFSHDPNLNLIEVPAGSVWKYQIAPDWSSYQSLIFHPTTGVLNTAEINFRQSPNLQARILGTLKKGEKVEVLKRSKHRENIGPDNDYWYRLERADGQMGWAYGAFIDFAKEKGE